MHLVPIKGSVESELGFGGSNADEDAESETDAELRLTGSWIQAGVLEVHER